jgi:hypothetical protein
MGPSPADRRTARHVQSKFLKLLQCFWYSKQLHIIFNETELVCLTNMKIFLQLCPKHLSKLLSSASQRSKKQRSNFERRFVTFRFTQF